MIRKVIEKIWQAKDNFVMVEAFKEEVWSHIPKGFHTATPLLVVNDGAKALEYYKEAFDAEVTFKKETEEGRLEHATIRIGDSNIMLGDECEPHEGHEEKCARSPQSIGGTTVNIYLYVHKADDVFKKAIKAGGIEIMPVQDMFWGDRVGMLKDPFGHSWSVATKMNVQG